MPLNKRQIQTKALMLCGRWLRVSRRGIALGSSCGCNFDVAIESGQLDELLLDHYIDLFSNRPSLSQWLNSHAASARSRRVDGLLQDLAEGTAKLPLDDSNDFMSALEVSIASVEEYHV